VSKEEIREGIEKELLKSYGTSAHQGEVSSQEIFTAGQILDYLHSQGVAIKGEGELPEIGWLGGNEVTNEEKAERVIGDMLKAGYTKWSPLI